MKKESQFETRNGHAYTVLRENVAERLTNIVSYQEVRNEVIAFNKSERQLVMMNALASIVITAATTLNKGSEFQIIDYINTWFIVAASMLVILFFVALYSRKSAEERLAPIKKIADGASDALKSYFIDFVEAVDFLDDERNGDLQRVSEFKVSTKGDNKKLAEKEFELSGFCHYKDSVVEHRVNLIFNADYSTLTVKNYDKVVAVSTPAEAVSLQV